MYSYDSSRSISPYPIRRALPLVAAISKDFNDQLLRVLGSQRPMYMEYETFEKTMEKCSVVFAAWDDNIKDFTNVAREGLYKHFRPFEVAH